MGSKLTWKNRLLILSVLLIVGAELYAIVDVTENTVSTASKISWALIGIGMVTWALWSVVTSNELSERRNREKKYYTFSFNKSYDFSHKYLGEEISGFLEEYEMGLSVFERDIVEKGIRNAMDEYRNKMKDRHSPKPAAEEPEGESYLMEAANGMLVRVPAEKLDQWIAAQRSGEISPELRKHKQQIKDRLMQEFYGKKE